jgi:hypothetical protein
MLQKDKSVVIDKKITKENPTKNMGNFQIVIS